MNNAFVQRLESRQMLSSGPLTGVELVGPVSAVNSIVLTFNTPLDAATSQNVLGYQLGKPAPGSPDDGFNIGDLFFRKTGHETADVKKPKAVKNGKIQFSSAVLDSANDTVTLTPVKPFKAQNFFRILRVRGVGAHAINAASGIPLNDGVDDVISWKMRVGKDIHYTDSQGNHVDLKLHGPGKLYVFHRYSKDPDPIVFIDGVKSTSRISATVLNGKFSAVTDIAEVDGGQGIADALLNNPSFVVQATVP